MKRGLFFLVVGLAVFGLFFVQTIDAQNLERSIAGTWVDTGGITWTFNTNGTLTFSDEPGKQYTYAVTATQLVYKNAAGDIWVFDATLSSNGRTMILVQLFSGYIDGPGWTGWLTKR